VQTRCCGCEGNGTVGLQRRCIPTLLGGPAGLDHVVGADFLRGHFGRAHGGNRSRSLGVCALDLGGVELGEGGVDGLF